MRKLEKIVIVFLTLICLFTSSVYANPYQVETSVNETSALLPKEVESDIATEKSTQRGDFFIQADLVITDQ